MTALKIYLASKSPRRRQLLERLGIAFESLDVEIDERPLDNEPAADCVARLALEKARAGRLPAGNAAAVLAADTEVEIDGKVLGKPRDEADAVRMLTALSGRRHRVHTAVALVHENERIISVVTGVDFRRLTQAECEAYCRTGEPMGKAGGYGIQGRAAAFVTRIEGSYSAVIGLPLRETALLLREAGLDAAVAVE